MKRFTWALAVLLPLLLPAFAAAQVQPGMFTNIVIIVQENRTPDNIFGAYATTPCTNNGNGGGYTLPGADLVNGGTNIGNGTGTTCNAYYPMNPGVTYGFRVPLLVVSEYTGTKSGNNYTGYISGACGTSCTNDVFPYQHDFGSILAFTEYNFGLMNIDQSGSKGYADYNAPDWDNTHSIPPLSDFFSLYTGSNPTGRPFFQIPVSNFPASFFANYYATHNASPTGPDPD